MTFLLDVNVVIALIDPAHNFHEVAHTWMSAIGRPSWATCPMTENGALRIIGHPNYPNFPGSPSAVYDALSDLISSPGHTFWPDDVSMLDERSIDMTRIMTAGQVTDSYLLALAVAHGGMLATLDRKLVTDAVVNGKQSLHLVHAQQ